MVENITPLRAAEMELSNRLRKEIGEPRMPTNSKRMTPQVEYLLKGRHWTKLPPCGGNQCKQKLK